MEKDLTTVMHRSSYGGGCMMMMSPSSCLPLHEEFQYSRIHNKKKGGKWRNLLKRLMREGKTVCGSKPHLSFQYDPVSYSQNFDDGDCHLHDHQPPFPALASCVSSTAASLSLDGLESTVKHQ
ncbi:uncharacterized protein G2W53_020421 [Senna tora]|uniref:Uncharacterized protein n=1 Tax=Senna tora TaxID=362788 RepID=A0A834TXV4_9FABA|nr:uncharacterized protein G2W53_020421 [Senna tora]